MPASTRQDEHSKHGDDNPSGRAEDDIAAQALKQGNRM